MAENKITYKTVIAQAIGDFNSIQNALATKSAGAICKAVDEGVVKTNTISGLIDQHLVYPVDQLTITNKEYLDTGIAVVDAAGAGRKGYASVKLTEAANWSLGDITNSTLTVGTTNTNNTYQITAAFDVVATPGTKGWIQTDTGTISSTGKIIGTIKAATQTSTSTGTLISSGWLAEEISFNVDGGSMKVTPSATLKVTKTGANDITSTILATSADGLNNPYTITVDPAAAISDFRAGYFAAAPSPENGTNLTYYLKSAKGLSVSALNGSSDVEISTGATNGKYSVTATNLSVETNHTEAGYTDNVTSYSATSSAKHVVGLIDEGGITTSSAITEGTTFKPSIVKVDDGTSDGSVASSSGGDIFASLEGEVTTTKPTSGYYLAVQTAAEASQTLTATGSARVSKAGYLHSNANITSNSDATTTVSMSKSDITYIPVAQGTCTVEGGVLSIKDSKTDTMKPDIVITANSTIGATLTGAKPSDGTFYVKVTGASQGESRTVSRSAITDAHTAGYIPAKVATTAIASADQEIKMAESSTEQYVVLPSATLANAKDTKKADTDYNPASVTLVSGGFLYINAGYIADTKVSLADLIPDFTDNEATADFMLLGKKAYTEDGGVITGNIDTLTLDTNYYTTDSTKGVGGIAGHRYVAAAQYIKKGSATISLSADSSFTPVINKVTGNTDNGKKKPSGDIYESLGTVVTSTKPSTGYYITVKSATQDAKTVSITDTGLTAGWITSADINSADTTTVSLTASEDTYIPVNAASVSSNVVVDNKPTVSISIEEGSGVTILGNGTTSNRVITLKNTENAGSVKSKYTVGGAGYVHEGQTVTTTATTIDPDVKINGIDVAANGTSSIYIKEGSISASSATATITNNAIPATASNKVAIVCDSTTNDLVKDGFVKIAATATGSVSLTEGYVDAINNTPVITKTGDEAYIPASIVNAASNSAPQCGIDIFDTTTYNSTSGAISGTTICEDSDFIATEFREEIEPVTAVTDAYDNKYIIGYVSATSDKGEVIVSVGPHTTGNEVDHYVEQLYKRLLGSSYQSVKDDLGNPV